jgi:hypothetical protein
MDAYNSIVRVIMRSDLLAQTAVPIDIVFARNGFFIGLKSVINNRIDLPFHKVVV